MRYAIRYDQPDDMWPAVFILMTEDPTDEELIAAYRNGDEEALRVLISRHLKLVFNLAYRLSGSIPDAEDIAQDVFVKVWKGIGSFDTNRKFKTWLLAIARNVGKDWLRKKRPALFSAFETEEKSFEDELEGNLPLPDEEAETILQSSNLRQAVSKLSSAQKLVIMLHNDEEMTFQEISEILGESINTVKSRYNRALIALKKALPPPAPK